AEEMSNNLVRMMVSTTLATITRLSLMVYDKEKGLAHRKSRVKGCGLAMTELLRVAEEAAEEMEAIDAEQACEQIQAAVNRGAQDLALGSEDTDHGQHSTGPGFDNSTSYKESFLEKKFKDINRRIKRQVKAGAKAEEVSLIEPFDLVELIENIKDGEHYQRATSVPNSKAEVPLLLTTETSTDPTYYYKVAHVMAEGAQRYVYEAVREVRGKANSDNL
ncbi:alpha-type protein kinase domain-containing protein, partial [Haematococcus lacustris]